MLQMESSEYGAYILWQPNQSVTLSNEKKMNENRQIACLF